MAAVAVLRNDSLQAFLQVRGRGRGRGRLTRAAGTLGGWDGPGAGKLRAGEKNPPDLQTSRAGRGHPRARWGAQRGAPARPAPRKSAGASRAAAVPAKFGARARSREAAGAPGRSHARKLGGAAPHVQGGAGRAGGTAWEGY